jgi:large subunit ribosomal protein L4
MRVGTASSKTGRGAWVEREAVCPEGYRQGACRPGAFPSVGQGRHNFRAKTEGLSYRIPRKMKRLAMMTILSQKNETGCTQDVEDFTVESGKTKDFFRFFRISIFTRRQFLSSR